jgi:formylglycine-generating enzyme required for sulfatase activity
MTVKGRVKKRYGLLLGYKYKLNNNILSIFAKGNYQFKAQYKTSHLSTSMAQSRDIGNGINNPSDRGLVNHLFLIGIDDYQHHSKLRNAVSDAQAIKDLLVKEYEFEEANVRELYNSAATYKNVIRQLKTYESLTSNDNLIVYYSGHGYYRRQMGYLVPVDGEEEEDFIPNTTIRDRLKLISAQHIVTIFDSCFSGSFIATRDVVTERLSGKPSRWMLAAGDIELVSDGIASHNSPFTGALLEILQESDNRELRIDDLFKKAQSRTIANGAEQTPIGGPLPISGHENGVFYFIRRNTEAETWAKTDLKSLSAVRAFIRQFPDSKSERMQQARILEGELQAAADREQDATRERDAYERAKKGDLSDMNRFLREHSQSAYSEEIKKLRNTVELEMDWKHAKHTDTFDAYEIFLEKYPDSSFSDIARNRITEKEEESSIAKINPKAHKSSHTKESTNSNIKKIAFITGSGLLLLILAIKLIPWGGDDTQNGSAFDGAKQPDSTSLAIMPSKENAELNQDDTLKSSAINTRKIGPDERKPVSPSEKTESSAVFSDPFKGQMVFIRGGTFKMGDTFEGGDPDEKVHTVNVSSFYMSCTEVTQAQWMAIMGNSNNPSNFKGNNLPVERVSWNMAMAFIKKLNEKIGKEGYYRLPTEAEWEYAASVDKNDLSRKFRFGNGKDIADPSQMNFDASPAGISRDKTTVVKNFKPNSWGLYDMAGNVWEWCNDWYSKDYYSETNDKKDPKVPGNDMDRVIRGGSYVNFSKGCRTANREKNKPNDQDAVVLGFRLAHR